jgi:hypothetical protein
MPARFRDLTVWHAVVQVGTFLFGAVIAIITQDIIERAEAIRHGIFPVVADNHTLILGWSSEVVPLLRQIAIHRREAEGSAFDGCVLFWQPRCSEGSGSGARRAGGRVGESVRRCLFVRVCKTRRLFVMELACAGFFSARLVGRRRSCAFEFCTSHRWSIFSARLVGHRWSCGWTRRVRCCCGLTVEGNLQHRSLDPLLKNQGHAESYVGFCNNRVVGSGGERRKEGNITSRTNH